MEQKHTPGPWKIWKEETQDTDLNILIEGEDGLPFCNVYDTPNEDIGWSHNRARKRAELIARAPELLQKVAELKERGLELANELVQANQKLITNSGEIEILTEKVDELSKEKEDAKFWSEEQAKGLNAAADRNAELSSELTKANHNILALTEQVEKLNKVIKETPRFNRIVELQKDNDRLREREKELVEALRELEPFAKEIIARQKNEEIFGYNGEILRLSTMKKIESILSKYENT